MGNPWLRIQIGAPEDDKGAKGKTSTWQECETPGMGGASDRAFLPIEY